MPRDGAPAGLSFRSVKVRTASMEPAQTHTEEPAHHINGKLVTTYEGQINTLLWMGEYWQRESPWIKAVFSCFNRPVFLVTFYSGFSEILPPFIWYLLFLSTDF